MTLSQIKQAQPDWFSRDNKRFFGDISYKVLHGKQTKKPYLIRSTYMWSDMFGNAKQLRYRINNVNPKTGKIESLVDEIFTDMRWVKEWLADN
jgi:hypothetical protein